MLLFAVLVLLPCSARSQTVYKHVDAHGRVTYTDRPPDTDQSVETRRFRAENQPLAALRFQTERSEHIVWVRNLVSGPIEVELRLLEPAPVVAAPSLPVRRMVAASTEVAAVRLRPDGSGQAATLSVGMRALPGDPAARHSEFLYQLPFETSNWTLGQGFNGSFSHQDPESRYAVDFGLDEGTPVKAARGGIVMQVEDDFTGNGLDREKFGSRANNIRILHDDGSMAIYGHLSVDSVMVRAGARVQPGQIIGASGNTGFSTGPHLHFAVQLNRGMQLQSVPFRMQGLRLTGD
ncbi:peptidoglycan DD-metalloendopeptidase family protein [Pseudomarimonas arenosa]|uniref:M23 family metallopeptidase n=1 Tax=Pseudomarimonas arenosa TaxID=2774145 RepID=A0AAW3ZLT0_9GAMM|nr:peptidoglycan DD-metalloendopeptidase family protein [Pseudomarimonas arenosa]MBD8526703.1 M23 family metallopeptidase [Pseudomarimonas arenosa]